jgi:chemotaxis protein MotB
VPELAWREVRARRLGLLDAARDPDEPSHVWARVRTGVEDALANNPELKAMAPQLQMEMTHDGLRIQIIDHDQRPMFASGSPAVQPYMRALLRAVGQLLAEVPNRLTLEGHTDALPFGTGGERGYGNWELSADRANASRRELLAGGLPEEHVLRVQGLAASNPFDRKDPTAPANRRISIIVMTRDAEDRVFRTALDRPGAPESQREAPAGSERVTVRSPSSPVPPPPIRPAVLSTEPPVRGQRP